MHTTKNNMNPKLIQGGCHNDARGSLKYNNEFDASAIKRIYTIENKNTNFIRAWQGHKIERRWFSAIQGSFEIKLIEIDSWNQVGKKSEVRIFALNSNSLDILYVPQGYISSIQAKEKDAKLLVMSDYFLGEIDDEYRLAPDFFEQ